VWLGARESRLASALIGAGLIASTQVVDYADNKNCTVYQVQDAALTAPYIGKASFTPAIIQLVQLPPL
jgi:hypothetical protein